MEVGCSTYAGRSMHVPIMPLIDPPICLEPANSGATEGRRHGQWFMKLSLEKQIGIKSAMY